MVTLMPLLFYRIKHLKRHSPVSMNSLPGCCSFAGRFYRLTKEQHAGFLNCWYLLGLFPPGFFIPAVIPSYTFFFLLKLEVLDSVSSLGFRDSFSAKLSRIWQIASRDSVTIFLFHETCKRVFFPSDLPYCLVRTLKSRKSFPIPSPKGLNEREKKFRDYGKRFQQPPDYSRIGEGNAGLSALFPG